MLRVIAKRRTSVPFPRMTITSLSSGDFPSRTWFGRPCFDVTVDKTQNADAARAHPTRNKDQVSPLLNNLNSSFPPPPQATETGIRAPWMGRAHVAPLCL